MSSTTGENQDQDIIKAQPGSPADDNKGDSETATTKNESAEAEPLLGSFKEVIQIVVRQQADIRETLRGTEEPNVYFIHDKATGEKLYQVQEDVQVFQQQCCGGQRSFNLRVFDKFNREVMLLKRPFACDEMLACCGLLGCGLFGCGCRDSVAVFIKNYRSLKFDWIPVGTVKQSWNPLFPTFNIRENEGSEIKLKLKGPAFVLFSCFTNLNFSIEDPKTGGYVGNIRKEWSGLCREFTTDADIFSMTFPVGENISEGLKATLLGALFLIDFKYFEGCQCCRICCAFI